MQAKKVKQRGATIFLITILIVPTIHWFIFWLYVNSSSFILAFKTQQGVWSLENFAELWRQLNNPYGATVGRALVNTLKYWAVNIGITFPLTIVIAYFIFKKILCYKFFRVIFFFPAIVTPIILVTVYTTLVSPNGFVDGFLQLFGGGIPPQGLFNPDPSAPNRATNAILIYCVWTGFGTNVILIGSAMARVPESVLEAASLDGCGLFRDNVIVLDIQISVWQRNFRHAGRLARLRSCQRNGIGLYVYMDSRSIVCALVDGKGTDDRILKGGGDIYD